MQCTCSAHAVHMQCAMYDAVHAAIARCMYSAHAHDMHMTCTHMCRLKVLEAVESGNEDALGKLLGSLAKGTLTTHGKVVQMGEDMCLALRRHITTQAEDGVQTEWLERLLMRRAPGQENDVRWLLGGEARRAAKTFLRERRKLQTERYEKELWTLRAGHPPDQISSNLRLAYLRTANRGPLVCSVLEHHLPHEIAWLASTNALDPSIANKVANACRKAGTKCREEGMFNSVGRTPRSTLAAEGVTIDEMMLVFNALSANQPDDPESKARWSQYAFVSAHSRKTEYAFKPYWYSELKTGDTKNLPHFLPQYKNQSPVAQRYGGRFYLLMDGEWFLVGYGTRLQRVMAELLINWLAANHLEKHDFFYNREQTGDEGFLGPSANANAALLDVRKVVQSFSIFHEVFSEGGRRRTGGGNWVDLPAADAVTALAPDGAQPDVPAAIVDPPAATAAVAASTDAATLTRPATVGSFTAPATVPIASIAKITADVLAAAGQVAVRAVPIAVLVMARPGHATAVDSDGREDSDGRVDFTIEDVPDNEVTPLASDNDFTIVGAIDAYDYPEGDRAVSYNAGVSELAVSEGDSDAPAAYELSPLLSRFLDVYLKCIILPMIVRHNFNLRCQVFVVLSCYGLWLFSRTVLTRCRPTARRQLAQLLTHYFKPAHITTCMMLSTSVWRRDGIGMAFVVLQLVCRALRLSPNGLSPGWMQLLCQVIFVLVDLAHTPAHPSVEQLLSLGSRLLDEVRELFALESLLWVERTLRRRWLARGRRARLVLVSRAREQRFESDSLSSLLCLVI